MNKKIVIVISYYNRPWHIRQTIDTIDALNIPNLEIVVVDDGSPFNPVEPVVTAGNKHVIKIPAVEKNWVTPVIPINVGFQKALDLGAEIIISQNPEAMWIGNIAEYVRACLTDDNYISFSCFSLDKENTYDPQLREKLDGIIQANNKDATYDGGNFWYNHPVHRPVAYDFCAAITRKNLLKLNGMDERFRDGCWYSDNNWVDRIRRLRLEIDIPHPEKGFCPLFSATDTVNPFVVHLWHYDKPESADKGMLIEKNKAIYDHINVHEKEIYKATHVKTPDLKGNSVLSFFNSESGAHIRTPTVFPNYKD